MRVTGSSKARRLAWRVAAYATLGLLLAVFLLPLLWIVGISFKTRMQTFSLPPLVIWRPTLDN